MYLFAAPTYEKTEFKWSSNYPAGSSINPAWSTSGSFGEWEFGYTGGVGYNFSDTTSAEIMVERIGGENLFGMGIKFHF